MILTSNQRYYMVIIIIQVKQILESQKWHSANTEFETYRIQMVIFSVFD